MVCYDFVPIINYSPTIVKSFGSSLYVNKVAWGRYVASLIMLYCVHKKVNNFTTHRERDVQKKLNNSIGTT